ncbi:MAG: hypothetical protein EA425_16260 [Puniceicoccaceae bacterium]|nr:MAG: hypothetical protein EA425_16260 [Puniceicoccaceae bacterium]
MDQPLKERIDRFKEGGIRAKGTISADGTLHGLWEWFRKDGTKLRSGHFLEGEQTGEWITYDHKGRPYKTTIMKPTRRKEKQ